MAPPTIDTRTHRASFGEHVDRLAYSRASRDDVVDDYHALALHSSTHLEMEWW